MAFIASHDFAINDFAITVFAPNPSQNGKIIDGKIIKKMRFCNRSADCKSDSTSSMEPLTAKVIYIVGYWIGNLSIWLLVISQALILPNYVAGFSGLFPFGLLYFLRVGKEEKMMLEEFGAEYEQYLKKTGRLIPKFRSD